MSKICPFRAMRPIPEKSALVAAVPYDVVNRDEANELASKNSLSFLHVSRSEIDLPPATNPYSDEVYSQASLNFDRLIKECPLVTEENPSLYLYRLRMGQHEQTGIAGCFSIDEYDSNQIKKHEKTRADKEDDRTRHIKQVSAQTGPVFLTYRHVSKIDTEVDHLKKTSPLFDFVAPDGVSHTVWLISDPSILVELFRNQVSALYIADGHHRAAAASRARADLKYQNPKFDPKAEYNYFLAVAFPDNQLRILPYHRLVTDLAGQSAEDFIEKLKTDFEITPGTAALPKAGEFGMYLQGKWYQLVCKTQDRSDAHNYPSKKRPLDVAVLQERLLAPILKIGDPRTDKRIDFVGGIRGTEELEKRVDSGKAAVAFSMHPTQLNEVLEISDEGGIMPPKSTWFEPKLRDGLLIHRI